MGVKDLWEYLQPAGQSRAFKNLVVSEGFESNASGRRGYRLGIDCSLWYQQVARAGGNDKGENPLLRGLFFKIIALAQLPIIPLFVFDGRNRPKEKRGSKMGKSGSHPLNKKMREFLEAFGMEWRMAHGEAEAELAVLNQTGVIDAILSDDADTFVFGAKVVIRNLGSELSGNKSNPALDLNQNKSSYHCMIYRADEIERNPRVRLTRGGMILFALLNGGDYDKGALGIGKVSARGLARCGFGDTLLEAYNNRNEESFHHFLRGWREDVNQELRTNSRGLLQSARPGMQLPPNFPDIELLELYTNPATSQSAGTTGGGQLKDNKQINLAKISSLCEELFEWGTRSAIVKRFRSLKLWDAAIITILRQVALEEDRKEVDRRIAAGIQDIRLRGVVRPPGQDSVPLDASLIRKYLDKNTEDYLAQAFVNRGPQSQVAEEDRIPLLKIVKKEKEHVKTDFMPEYKIEVDPEDFVQLTLSGIKGRRPESFVITGDETDESEDGEAQTTGNRKKSKKKQPDPLDPYSMNCPASILVIVDPKSVQLFEQGINDKERKKEDAENAKFERARERERKAQEKAAAKEEREKERERKKKEKEEKASAAKAKGKGKQKRKSVPQDSGASDEDSSVSSTPSPQKKRKPNKKSAKTTGSQDVGRDGSVTGRGTGLTPFPLSSSSSQTFPASPSSPIHRSREDQPGPSRSRSYSVTVDEDENFHSEEEDIDFSGGFLFSMPETDNPDHLERSDLNGRFRKDLPTQASWSEVGPTVHVPDDVQGDEDVDMVTRDDMLDKQFEASFMSQAHSRPKKSQPTRPEPKTNNSAKPSNTTASSTTEPAKSRLKRITPAPKKRTNPAPDVASAPAPASASAPKVASSSAPSASQSRPSVSSGPSRRHSSPLFTFEAAPLLQPETPPFPERITDAEPPPPSLFLPSPSPIPQRTHTMERHSSATSIQSSFGPGVIELDSDNDDSASFGVGNRQRAQSANARKSAPLPYSKDDVIDLS